VETLRAAASNLGKRCLQVGFLASIFATTELNPFGSVASSDASRGALRSWCWSNFCVVFPSNGGLPMMRAKNDAPSE
jgi:hypothetical protein